jgi:ribosomal protein S18 acetylase RimI-like enzyme
MTQIRRATTDDAAHIALLGRITYTESHGNYIENKEDLLQFYDKYYSVSQIQKELKDANNLFWIGFSDQLPIGFGKLSIHSNYPKLAKVNSCRLQRLYILNDFISFKIGSQLLEIILEKSTFLKFENIWLSVYYKNTKGINFYKKYDFNKIGETDFFVGEKKYENLVFAKNL